MTNVLCTCLLATNVKHNTLVKLLTTFVADGTITSVKVKVLKEMKSAYKNTSINISNVKGILFLVDVSLTLIDKTDISNPTKKENYRMQTLKTYAPYGLDVVDSI